MKRALVVDDTKNIRILLEKTLELEGFTVETASTGSEALDKLRSQEYDLVFLDIKLPEVSGTEVLRKIRSEGNNTPVIIITAYPTVKNAVDCIQLGAITYLQKPFTADRLKNTLKQFNLDIASSPAQIQSERSVICEQVRTAFSDANYEKAIELISSLLSADPTEARLYKLLAKAYKRMGDDAMADKFARTYCIFKDEEQ
ncbi:MAG: response regulator [Firmicutes bacterium]|nr:response regulator [Bacillota bacterium]